MKLITQYDRNITRLTCDWIKKSARQDNERPWILNVGLVAPHFPLIAPQEFYDLYDGVQLPPPRQYDEADRPCHPVLDAMRAYSNYDDAFDEAAVRIARQAYYGLVSFLDHNIGLILKALKDAGLEDATRIIYTSDHGDNLGHRGLWGKSVMYDDAVAVPLIVAGPELPEGLRVDTPVSLVDLHPSILEFAGAELPSGASDLPGESLAYRFPEPKARSTVIERL